jgi:hypothetical protein
LQPFGKKQAIKKIELKAKLHASKQLGSDPNSCCDPNYWSALKTRLKKEASELTPNCSQLKMIRE